MTLLGLYREVLTIIERIRMELPGLAMLDNFMRSSTRPGMIRSSDPAAVDATMVGNIATGLLNIDVKALYHWAYTIELFVEHSSARDKVDLAELRRVSIFRHKLMVHHAQTPMRKRGLLVSSAHSWGPDPETFRVVSHPLAAGGTAWRGNRRKLARLNRYIPALKGQPNLWEKIDLIYRHFNAIPQADQRWVRNELFGSVGLRSDPPAVVADALLGVLVEYEKAARL